jgi:hypothetical protein
VRTAIATLQKHSVPNELKPFYTTEFNFVLPSLTRKEKDKATVQGYDYLINTK